MITITTTPTAPLKQKSTVFTVNYGKVWYNVELTVHAVIASASS